MNLKAMLAPAIMGMAFMGLMSTVNVAVADEVDDMANELQAIIDQSTADEAASVDEILNFPSDCTRCANRVGRAIDIVVAATALCNRMESRLEVMRDDCKAARGITPSSPFRAKCDVVTNGRYGRLLDLRQGCRDALGLLVTWRNGVEHKCYGEPLYCHTRDPNWPY